MSADNTDEYGREVPLSGAGHSSRPALSSQPHIIPDDLQFLVNNKVALRWQHTSMHEQFLKEGLAGGDAYSLGDRQQWAQPDAGKASEFETSLRDIVRRMLNYNSGFFVPGGEGGVLMLAKDVKNADTPVRDKGGIYKESPIYPIGIRLGWRPGQMISAVAITPETAQAQGYDGRSSGDIARDRLDFDRLADHHADLLIRQIKEARGASLHLATGPAEIFSGGVDRVDELLRGNLSSDGRQFGFDGEFFRVRQPVDHEAPESRTLFATLKLLERNGALTWKFKGENIVIASAETAKLETFFSDPESRLKILAEKQRGGHAGMDATPANLRASGLAADAPKIK